MWCGVVWCAGCASSDEKFEQVLYSGDNNFTLWFVPPNYQYGVTPMSWADPSMYLTYANNPSAGEVVVGDVSGKQFSFREGRGVTSDFLTRQLTDGTVCGCMYIKPTIVVMYVVLQASPEKTLTRCGSLTSAAPSTQSRPRASASRASM
jgi:hypothetical protein